MATTRDGKPNATGAATPMAFMNKKSGQPQTFEASVAGPPGRREDDNFEDLFGELGDRAATDRRSRKVAKAFRRLHMAIVEEVEAYDITGLTHLNALLNTHPVYVLARQWLDGAGLVRAEDARAIMTPPTTLAELEDLACELEVWAHDVEAFAAKRLHGASDLLEVAMSDAAALFPDDKETRAAWVRRQPAYQLALDARSSEAARLVSRRDR